MYVEQVALPSHLTSAASSLSHGTTFADVYLYLHFAKSFVDRNASSAN
jgi:hypothetical protein